MTNRPSLDIEEYRILTDLVAQPSYLMRQFGIDDYRNLIEHTPGDLRERLSYEMDLQQTGWGQAQKLQMIERLIGNCPNCLVRRMPVDQEKGLYVLIVQKGNPQNAKFSIMIPAHVDTVVSVAGDANRHKVTPDSNNPDIVRGLGVYDMQAAVMMNIKLARTLNVPEDVCVYFVFTPEEEGSSSGARRLIDAEQGFDRWNQIDLVLSAEIGHIDVPLEAPNLRFIAGRKGVIRIDGSVTVQEEGHAAEDDSPNPPEIKRYFLNELQRRMQSEAETPEMKILGRERVKDWRNRTGDSRGAVFAKREEFGYMTHLVHPRSLEEVVKVQMACFEDVVHEMGIERDRVELALSRNTTRPSYQPFVLDQTDPVNQMIMQGMRDFTAKHNPTIDDACPIGIGAPAWSDECLYATRQPRTFSIPYIGGGAHNPNEWVSLSSVAERIGLFRHLITKTIPEHLRKQ